MLKIERLSLSTLKKKKKTRLYLRAPPSLSSHLSSSLSVTLFLPPFLFLSRSTFPLEIPAWRELRCQDEWSNCEVLPDADVSVERGTGSQHDQPDDWISNRVLSLIG